MSRDLCNAVQTERPMLYKLKHSMISEKRGEKLPGEKCDLRWNATFEC
jgi:hypothetical protein